METLKKEYSKSIIKYVIISFLSMLAFAVNMSTDLSNIKPVESSIQICNIVLDVLNKVRAVVGEYSFSDIFIFAGIFYFFWNTDQMKEKKKLFSIIPAALFTLFTVLGYSYKMIDSWDLVFGSGFTVFMSIIISVGYFLLYKRIIECLFCVLDKTATYRHKVRPRFIEAHPLIASWILLFILWIPYIIIRYPGAADYSAKWEIQQFFGQTTFTTHHPPFHTIILGSCVYLGKLFGSNNLGIFFYVLMQCIIFTFALAYCLSNLKKWKCPTVVRNIIFCIYGFFPMFPIWGTTAIKDTLYVAVFIIYMLLLIDIIRVKDIALIKIIIFSVVMLLVMLLRNNAIYLIFPTSICLVIFKFKQNHEKSQTKSTLVKWTICVLMPVIIYFCFNAIVTQIFSIEKGSVSESFPIPIQQTARYVKEYGDEVTVEEAEILSQVLDYENMAENYYPYNADPVKFTWNNESTTEDLGAYISVWFGQLRKHPGVYIEAAINTNYGFFYPGIENIHYYRQVEGYYNEGDFVFSRPVILKNISDVILDIIEVLDKVPVYNLLNNAGFYTWIFILIIFVLLRGKHYNYMVATIPLIMNLCVCIAAPAFMDNARYNFPLMFFIPTFVGLLISLNKQQEILEKTNIGLAE